MNYKEQKVYFKNFHYWHIVNISPWPFFLSIYVGFIPLCLVSYMQGYNQGYFSGLLLFSIAILTLNLWFRDVIIEATYQGFHTKQVQKNIYISFALFIFSEVMLFVAFFWAFFHSSIFPTMELNMSWPPIGFNNLIMEPFEIPFLNTLILLLSGATLTLAHLCLKRFSLWYTLNVMVWTIYLASLFIVFQGFEYFNSSFDISDSVYGATFFMCTGLHGFHVILGNTALILTTFRIYFGHFSRNHHIGFELAAWYWHFVDVVWLFLFIVIYYLGNNLVIPVIIVLTEDQKFFINYWC
jgi:heme/copper-type cytochrome/quinol oxidase subunit 3